MCAHFGGVSLSLCRGVCMCSEGGKGEEMALSFGVSLFIVWCWMPLQEPVFPSSLGLGARV